MKLLFKLVIPILLVFFFTLISCNNEELFEEEIAIVEETVDESEEETSEDENEETDVDSSLPCDFTLQNIDANSTIIINCIMDLGGATINLPSSVTILYEGGDIINGTLNFSDDSIIAGELLNQTLTLVGSTPQLRDSVFEFSPNRWGIVEGRVTGEQAMINKNIVQDLVDKVKELGVKEFHVDELDVYFYVGSIVVGETVRGPGYRDARNALTIPSDFSFIMTDNTHIRVQPNNHKIYGLIGVTDGSENILIEGGHLYGDRNEHDYSDGELHGYGHLLRIAGAIGITVRGVTMRDGTGDGLNVAANVISTIEGHISSNNIHIEDCVFDSNGRLNLSITDGYDIYVERNTFLNAGVDTPTSPGIAPRYAIDIEAYRVGDVRYEEASNIYIRDNIEKGSYNGAFIVAIGEDVIIENNTTENSISYQVASGVIIKNNTITAVDEENITGGTGITCGRNDSDAIFNNKVYNNTINNFSTGIYAVAKKISNDKKDLEIVGNKINECITAIRSKGVANGIISDNIISSTNESSNGISTSLWLDDVEINGNIINVPRKAFTSTDLNNDDEHTSYSFVVNENTFNDGVITLSNIRGLESFYNNTLARGLEVYNSTGVNLIENTINVSDENAIYLRQENFDIDIDGNIMSVTNTGKISYDCIKIQETTNASEINILDNNNCN